MPSCSICWGNVVRVRRTFGQKFIYHAILKCKKCDRRETKDQWFLFLLGGKSRCPRCGSYRVEKLRGIDHIDRMYKNPLSYLQRFLGGSLHWCPFCRLQFYDVRKKSASVKRPPRIPVEVTDMAKSGE